MKSSIPFYTWTIYLMFIICFFFITHNTTSALAHELEGADQLDEMDQVYQPKHADQLEGAFL